MKNNSKIQCRSKIEVLRQICNLIPPFLVPKIATETGVDKRCRTISPWSHVVALLYAQLTRSISLNDVCDALRLLSGPLSAIRAAMAPSANGFSSANRVRDCQMGEKLLWAVLDSLEKKEPKFAQGKRRLHRFKRRIQAVDSTVIRLVANCMDWAKHRRRKAATKLHLRLDLQSFLPRFAILDLAPHHDNTRAAAMCAGIKAGEIAIFDKAFFGFKNLRDLTVRGVFWVIRPKEDMDYRVVQRRACAQKDRVLKDQIIRLRGPKSKGLYPEVLRRVVVLVEMNGVQTEMAFLTNNMEWSAQTIGDLYRCRWDIELFFKQVKQSLQLCDFLGNSANAVHWQIWMALLVYVLLRYLAFLSRWSHSFTRLWAITRTSLWRKMDLLQFLKSYGIAGKPPRMIATPEQAYFPGFQAKTEG